MVKAIFFDMDGVLFQGSFKKGIRLYEQEFNIPEGKLYEIMHDFQGWKDFTLGLVTEEEFFGLCKERAAEYKFNTVRLNQLLMSVVEIDTEFISYIKNELAPHYVLGIISNNPKEWYDRYIEKVGIKGDIKVLALSSIEHIRKPDKRLFQIALDKSGITATEAVYVDDRPERVDGARKLGMHIIEFNGNIKAFKERLKVLT